MKLEIGHNLRRFWRFLDRIEKTPILDLEKNLVVPDGPFDCLTALSRRSRVARELIEEFQLTSAEVYEWQTKFPAEIKLLWCLLDLISRIERTSIKVGIFWEMLDKKNNYGMLWKWTDADKQKLLKALELMEYILHQLGLSAGKIVVSHKDYRGLSVPDIGPELKQLSIKLMNLEQITPVEILVALQINPTLLNLTLPTGLEQLCNFMVNNTLDFFRLYLNAIRDTRSVLSQALRVDSSPHTVVSGYVGGSGTSRDENPFKDLGFFGRRGLEEAYARQYTNDQAPQVSLPPGTPNFQRHLPDVPQHSIPPPQHGHENGGGDALVTLAQYLVSKPSNGP